MPVRRRFLPWDRPLLPQAAEFLSADWSGQGPLDLSAWLVVVPTRQAGRRLREALAERAGARNQAAFSPRVITPEALVAPAPAGRTASRLESLLAWIEVLRAADLQACRHVFPLDPPGRGFTWALRLADQLLRVQAALAEAGLRFGLVPERLGGAGPEIERWRQLAALEREYDAKLAERGRQDGQRAKMAAAGAPELPPGVERIAMIGTPDPLPLALEALAALARRQPVEVVVFAPESEAAAFDEWGRPRPAGWEDRARDLPDFAERVRLCADPAAQADAVAALAERYGRPEGLLAVGSADGDVRAALAASLRRSGFESYDPNGRSRRQGELYHLLAALAALDREPTFDAVEALGRCPPFLEFLSARSADFSPAGWLAGLDALRRHFPESLTEAEERTAGLAESPDLRPGLEAMGELRRALATEGFAEGALGPPASIFAARRLDLSVEKDARWAEAAEAWGEVVRDCAAAGPGLSRAEGWEIALQLFGEGVEAGDKPPGAVELQGWLELLWEDAPHLVVAGMNEGCAPESVVGDPFLPESLREKLGLKTNPARFARDAYLLQALAAGRSRGGRTDLLLGRVSAAGDPLRPSRLLLCCPDEELPARAEFLFRAIPPARPTAPWTRAWRLTPPREPPPSRLAVTALRDWLECPFRFYLRRVLGLAPSEASSNELDEIGFGLLCHSALEALGREPRLADSTDPDALGAFLSDRLDQLVRADYGRNPPLPLIVQREAARQRLAKAGEVQARERAAGWRIAAVERKIELKIAGLAVNGQIDRIDRHERTGAVRVLDYKTSDLFRGPDEVHLRSTGAAESAPEWARCGRRVWTDLQLPFYRQALAAEYPEGVACGYFNLPKAVGATGLAIWPDYSPELHRAALRCAEGVCRAIRQGEFWPPNEGVDPERDAFLPLFHRGAAASLAWEGRGR